MSYLGSALVAVFMLAVTRLGRSLRMLIPAQHQLCIATGMASPRGSR